MKNILVLMLAVISVAVICGCSAQQSSSGRVVFTMTDAAADMGSVSSVQMTVDRVQAHSQASGWVTLSDTQRTYDLLQLKAEGRDVLLADSRIATGTYDQIQVEIKKVVVVDAQGQHEAIIPSGNFRVNGDLIVEQNTASIARFDFHADESLHVASNGEYVAAPVAKVETFSEANVTVSGNDVNVIGGRIRTNVVVGMDINGNVGVGLGIPANANLRIDGGVVSIVNLAANGRVVVGVTDVAANMGTVSSVDMTVNSVQAYSTSRGWVTLSSEPKTYNLLQLRSESSNAVLADTEAQEDTYQQIRLNIAKVVITNASGTFEAEMPSNDFTAVAELVVAANSTATALFDFDVSKSLHKTNSSDYVMAPVVALETRKNAQATLQSNNRVAITGGQILTHVTIGMDINGNVGVGLLIPANAVLSVTSQGSVVVL